MILVMQITKTMVHDVGFYSCVANNQDDSINRYLRRDCFLQRGSRYYVMGLDSCDANNQDNDTIFWVLMEMTTTYPYV